MPLQTSRYDLQGLQDHQPVRVTYTQFTRVAGVQGQVEPQFLPADRLRLVHGSSDRTVSAADFATVPTAVGTLLTVEVEQVPDLGTITVAILIPEVAFADGADAQPLHTVAVQSLLKSSLAPQTDIGQLQAYDVVHLHGHATRSVDGSIADAAHQQPVSAASPTG